MSAIFPLMSHSAWSTPLRASPQNRSVAPVGTDVGGLPVVLNVGDSPPDEKRTQVFVHCSLDCERLPVVGGTADAVQAGLGRLDLDDGQGVVVRLGQDRPDIADLRVAQECLCLQRKTALLLGSWD